MWMAPRDWLVHPEQFGRIRQAPWEPTPPDPREAGLLAAAYWQHLFVCDAEAQRLAKEMTWAEVSEGAGIDAGTLGKVVRGHRPMTLSLMLGVTRVLGAVEILPSHQNIDDLLP